MLPDPLPSLKPVVPFEPMLATKIPQGSQWMAQVKWDGVRVLTYYDGFNVRLFNRKLHERTMQYPELVDINRYCAARSVILDGEVIALVKGTPSFHQVMKRDGIRLAVKVEQARRVTPVVYMVFDVLYVNGNWVLEHPLTVRQRILAEIIKWQEQVQTVENFTDGPRLFAAVENAGLEGVVCKRIDSPYAIGGKDERWQKVKNYRDVVAVVGGVTYRDHVVNAVLLGLYDHESRLWYIGHAGTGRLTRADWRALTERVRALIIRERPFYNQPQRLSGATWVKPEITAKVQFLEWTAGMTLRQPSIQAFTEVPPESCLFE